MTWEICRPYLNPPGMAPGWHFIAVVVGPKKGAKPRLVSHGPYATELECRRIIATEKPCHSCKGMTFAATPEDEQRAKAGIAAGGVGLCEECGKAFDKWHKKTHGKAPRNPGVQ